MAATPNPGNWIELTRDATLDFAHDAYSPLRVLRGKKYYDFIKKGTVGKVKGKIGYQWIITFNNIDYQCYLSDIKFKTISPKKYTTLEILYGQK